jgi:hypothetical protein
MKATHASTRVTRSRRNRVRRALRREKPIDRPAAGGIEFQGNLRKSAGFLGALLEIVEWMGPGFSATSPDMSSLPSPRRA